MKVAASLAGRRLALVDSSAYLAILDQDDEHHKVAQDILAALTDAGFLLLTTNFVVAESHALILSALGHREASEFLREIGVSRNRVLRVQEVDEQRARDIIFRYEDKDFSMVDCTSFALIERLSISCAFAFDRHFAQYGIQTLE
ncbi:MAG TPA: PIN domain-containing protein [Dehalococcoidia bacterium]|nr:PIN domain-containing protein [Dehalococcoidia bacterium]